MQIKSFSLDPDVLSQNFDPYRNDPKFSDSW